MLDMLLYFAFVSVSSCYNLPTYIPAVAPAVVPAMLFSDRSSHTKGSGVLQVDVKLNKPDIKAIRKRQSLTPMDNVINGYTIDISIGTPPQQVTVIMDTGSSELWVDPVCANSWNPSLCDSSGRYLPSLSSTDVGLNITFSIQYGSGDVSGEYLTDNITMGSAKIIAQQFGLANTSSYTTMGIMGVGFGYQLDTKYYNIIDQLYVQSVTKSRAFSLDLASIDVAQGSIIFGGIDTMKYIGALEKRPIIPYFLAPDGYPRYWISMTSVGITQPGESSSTTITVDGYDQPIFPDSGSTLSALPTALFNELLAYFPDAVSQGGGTYTVPCSYRTQAGSIDFGFGGTVIRVNYHEWFWFDGAECWFGAQSADSTWTLGDSFMRSAYIVYDQDNANILLAQATNCGTNIVPISTGVNAVPSIIGGCNVSSTTSTSRSTSSTRISSSQVLTTPSSSNVKTASFSSIISARSTGTAKTATLSSKAPSASSSKAITATSSLKASSSPISSIKTTPTPGKSSSIASSSRNLTPSTSSTIPPSNPSSSIPSTINTSSKLPISSSNAKSNLPLSSTPPLSTLPTTASPKPPSPSSTTNPTSSRPPSSKPTSIKNNTPAHTLQTSNLNNDASLTDDPVPQAEATQCCGLGSIVYVTRLTVVIGVEGVCSATGTAVGMMF